MTDLRELEKRLEEAAGPDRELDHDLKRAFGGAMSLQPNPYLWRARGGGGFIDVVRFGPGGNSSDTYVENFTASLDAAVALVERIFPEREWALSVDKENGKACADVADDVWDESFENIRAFSKAPPLALCLALVRALIAAKGDRHD